MEGDLLQDKVLCHTHDTREKPLLVYLQHERGTACTSKYSDKYLGVQLTSNLDWGTHVQPFQQRLIGLSDYSNAVFNTVLLASRRQHTKTWCETQMQYCSSVWDPNEKGDVTTLEKVQCRAARFVKNDYRRESTVSEVIKELGWHSLRERRTVSRLTLLYKKVHGLIDEEG